MNMKYKQYMYGHLFFGDDIEELHRQEYYVVYPVLYIGTM